MLRLEKMTRTSSECGRVGKLLKEAFPPAEYMSLEDQLDLQDDGYLSVYAIKDDGTYVGMTSIAETNDLAYIFFLAVEEEFRSKGYGGRTLQTISDLYCDRIIIVDFELPDESAPNNPQRLRRRSFYLRAGFGPTGWGFAFGGVSYEIFSKNRPFGIDRFKEMLTPKALSGMSIEYFRVG